MTKVTTIPNLPTFFVRDSFLTPFDKLFDSMFETNFPEFVNTVGVTPFQGSAYPKVNVYEYDDKVGIVAEIPGLDKKNVTVDVEEDVEALLRDEPEVPAVPESKKKAFANVEELLKIVQLEYPAAKAVAEASASINKDDVKTASFAELSMAEQAWLGLSKEDQITQINMVLDEKVRPALMADGGNVQVLDVVEGEKVMIKYQGACGNCGSSLGATLSFMEQALRKDIYNELIVVPNM